MSLKAASSMLVRLANQKLGREESAAIRNFVDEINRELAEIRAHLPRLSDGSKIEE